jgi:hypothetical protein
LKNSRYSCPFEQNEDVMKNGISMEDDVWAHGVSGYMKMIVLVQAQKTGASFAGQQKSCGHLPQIFAPAL